MYRREFTTAGVAAGVSAGFNAPIGGLLFAMEDLSSFWTKTLSWQTFFCCVIAAIVAQVFNTAFDQFDFRGEFGAFNVQVRPQGPFLRLISITAARCVTWRCVARDIETPIMFLFLSIATQRNAQP